jgi:hypothetical protein
MPDGEILHGRYEQEQAPGFSGAHPATAFASGPKTTIHCRLTIPFGSHGSGVCETTTGAHYQVSF